MSPFEVGQRTSPVTPRRTGSTARRKSLAREPFANVLERPAPFARAARAPEIWAEIWGGCLRDGRARRMLRERSALKGAIMLWTIVLILLVLWAVGLVTSTTMGGLIHFLLVAAVIVVLVRLIQGRRVV